MIDPEALKADLRRDEGLRLAAYADGGGVLTIGYGHTAGVQEGDACTQAQADLWLDQDAKIAVASLDCHASWWKRLPEPVCRGLANACFNLGWPRLSGFGKMLAALEARDYATAADEALDSLWAKQVGARADRIAALFRGDDPDV